MANMHMYTHVWMQGHAHTQTHPGTVVRVLHILIHLILTPTKWARYEWGKEPLKYVTVTTQLEETHKNLSYKCGFSMSFPFTGCQHLSLVTFFILKK